MTRSQPTPRRRASLALLLLGVVLALGVWSAVQIARAANDLEAGRDAAAAAREELAPATIRSGAAGRSLDHATRRFHRAGSRLRHPLLAPARSAPVVGRQLRAMQGLARSAESVTATAGSAADELRAIFEAPRSTGADRLAILDRLSGSIEQFADTFAEVDLGPSEALMGPLARAHNEVAAQLAEAEMAADDAGAAIAAVTSLLRGPSRYLVLASNNAEMRAGSGMWLSVGVLEAHGGELRLRDLQRTSEVALEGEGVAIEGDLADRWGWTNPNREWRNLGMTPRFDANAELARRMWLARTGEEVDGVLSLDVLALGLILDTTGPVEVDGRRLDGDDVVPYLLNDQYDGLDDDDAQVERRERLGELAALTIERLQAGAPESAALAAALMEAVERRHLLAWSADAAAQEGWLAAGVAGTMTERSLMVSVLNRAGNKLDWFLRIDNDLTIGDDGTTELRVRLENRVSPDEPRYVQGPDRRVDLPPGQYLGLVAVTLPRGTKTVAVDGGAIVVRGPDGPTEVVAVEVQVPPLGSDELVFQLMLPDIGELRIEPSARESPARWTVGDRKFRDHRPHVVQLPNTQRGG